jgi:antitoxin component YwqK of YwqJK toxin-antitoxin module
MTKTETKNKSKSDNAGCTIIVLVLFGIGMFIKRSDFKESDIGKFLLPSKPTPEELNVSRIAKPGASGPPPNGPLGFNYRNGQRTLIHLKDSRLNGSLTSWYANGDRAEEGNCTNNKPNGAWTSWYEDGRIERNATYIEGKLISVVVWLPNGELCPDSNISDGDGAASWYYPDGQKRSVGRFKSGKLNGISTVWHENGKKRFEGYWNDFSPWDSGYHPRPSFHESRARLNSNERNRFLARLYELSPRASINDGRFHPNIVWHPNGDKLVEQKCLKFQRWRDFTVHKSLRVVHAAVDLNLPTHIYSTDALLKWRADSLQKKINAPKPDPKSRLLQRFQGDSHKQGTWTYWYKNGQIKIQVNFNNGALNGSYEEWDDNAQKRFEGNYSSDKLVGTSIRWYKNGQIKEKANFNNGVLNGSYEEWHDNGQKRFEGNYSSDKLVGTSIRWYKNGQIKEKANSVIVNAKAEAVVDAYGYNYTTSSIHGLLTRWYDNGQKEFEGKFSKGLEADGVHISWWRDGKKANEGTFEKQKMEGLHVAWYSNGKKRSETFYKAGLKAGLCSEWYDTGQKKSEDNFSEGKAEGFHIIWWPNGNKLEEGTFENGLKTGSWMSFNKDGEMWLDRNYTDADITSSVLIEENVP